MQQAVYNQLNLKLEGKQVLSLYYRLTTYMREKDSSCFSEFMEFRNGLQTDHDLMALVLANMQRHHPIALQQVLQTIQKEMAF